MIAIKGTAHQTSARSDHLPATWPDTRASDNAINTGANDNTEDNRT